MLNRSRLLRSAALCLFASYASAAASQSTTPAPAGTAPPPADTAPPPAEPGIASMPYDPADDAGVDIVVTGLRQSLESAEEIKREAVQIVDSIVADDIGKLPDRNVSEALARIPGIQVDRASGEAGRVLIRGLPDFTTTYNGRDIFTAESRRVAPQDFPAGGVAALEVFKTTTADLVEGSLAGLINVRSRRPFDFKGLEVAGSLNLTYANQSNTYDWNGNLLLSNRWETSIGEIGVLVNAAYTGLEYLDSARFDGGFIATARPEQSTAGPFRFPDAVGIFYGAGNRWRPSVNAAVQWLPTPELEIYGDFLFQGFRREVSDRQLFVPLFGDARFTDVVLQPGTNQAQSLVSTGQVRPDLFQAGTRESTNTYQYAIGGIYTGDRIRWSADLARTDSTFDLSIYSFDSALVSAPTVVVNFDVPQGDRGVQFSFPEFDLTDPANYVYRGFFDRQLIATGEDWQFRTDLQYETGLDFLPRVQVGFRYVDRDGSFQNGERYNFQEPLRLPLSATPLSFATFRPGFAGSSIQPTRTWVTATYDDIRGNVDALRDLAGFPDGPPPPDPQSAYTANEKSYADYLQVGYAFDLGVPIDGVVGIRAIKTETELNGTSRIATGGVVEFVPVVDGNDYTDYLPNVSARVHFTDELQLRLSYTQTRTRPDFAQLNPGLVVDPPSGICSIDPASPDCFRTARGGNPDLQPILSDNYDASLEYYFSSSGFGAVALFRRDIDGFIFNTERRLPDPEFRELRVTRPENGGQGRLQGVEVQVTTFFDFAALPEWARGFGIQANYTYIDGKQAFPTAIGADLPELQQIPGVSKNTYNLIGLYERGRISARLAYNYRSEFVNFYEVIPGGRFAGEYTDGIARLDFSFSYTPVEQLTIAFDVSNLLGDPFRNFRNYNADEDTFPRDVRYEETVYSLGIRFRL